jgi:hypothetical protein
VPDHLPEALKDSIRRFPPGTLQFEIGIQSFNPEVQATISRKQNNEKAVENLRWLREDTHAHLHVDLIAVLPGEDIASFAQGFDQLVALQPHEIQMGILKRLRGTPIIRHTDTYGLVFDPAPPYQVLATSCIDFGMMQRIVRFARYWDLVANSGRFAALMPAVLGDQPFARFLALSDWLYSHTDATHRISPERLARLLDTWLQAPPDRRQGYQENPHEDQTATQALSGSQTGRPSATRRQQRHQAALPSALARQASINERVSSPSEESGRVRARSKIINA